MPSDCVHSLEVVQALAGSAAPPAASLGDAPSKVWPHPRGPFLTRLHPWSTAQQHRFREQQRSSSAPPRLAPQRGAPPAWETPLLPPAAAPGVPPTHAQLCPVRRRALVWAPPRAVRPATPPVSTPSAWRDRQTRGMQPSPTTLSLCPHQSLLTPATNPRCHPRLPVWVGLRASSVGRSLSATHTSVRTGRS